MIIAEISRKGIIESSRVSEIPFSGTCNFNRRVAILSLAENVQVKMGISPLLLQVTHVIKWLINRREIIK
jgi:hypothetical protein